MKISVTDKHRSGIMAEFAKAIGATIHGRYFRIPEDKGEGYITGFSWEHNELRMMVRNYYLYKELLIERTNELAEGQDDIIFMMSGNFSVFGIERKTACVRTAKCIYLYAGGFIGAYYAL